jgi:DNA-nicking Smr family endonuclease
MPKDTLNQSESDVFRDAVSDVRPLKTPENPKKTTKKKNYSDSKIFREAVSDAFPLTRIKTPKINLKQKPKPIPIQSLLDEREALLESRLTDINSETLLDTDEKLSYARNGISSTTIRKLRRGNWSIQGELDLHGYITSEAREIYYQFIKQCSRTDKRCVRIIHGKGLRSKGKEPVLKNKVRGWLMQTDVVLAFCQAPRQMGGSGAVLVLLKAHRHHFHQF